MTASPHVWQWREKVFICKGCVKMLLMSWLGFSGTCWVKYKQHSAEQSAKNCRLMKFHYCGWNLFFSWIIKQQNMSCLCLHGFHISPWVFPCTRTASLRMLCAPQIDGTVGFTNRSCSSLFSGCCFANGTGYSPFHPRNPQHGLSRCRSASSTVPSRKEGGRGSSLTFGAW